MIKPFLGWKYVFLTSFNKKVNIVAKIVQSAYLCVIFHVNHKKILFLAVLRDGPLEKWLGDGEFSACTNFFSLTACAGIFFSGEPLYTNFFFQTNIAFFRTVKSWFIISVFVLYKLFYTHNRSKDTGHFNAKSFRKCTHSERGGSHVEWTASLYFFYLSSYLLII